MYANTPVFSMERFLFSPCAYCALSSSSLSLLCREASSSRTLCMNAITRSSFKPTDAL